MTNPYNPILNYICHFNLVTQPPKLRQSLFLPLILFFFPPSLHCPLPRHLNSPNSCTPFIYRILIHIYRLLLHLVLGVNSSSPLYSVQFSPSSWSLPQLALIPSQQLPICVKTQEFLSPHFRISAALPFLHPFPSTSLQSTWTQWWGWDIHRLGTS